MSTNSIGAGNKVFSFADRAAVISDLGRLAAMRGARSTGAYVKMLLHREISAARLRGELAQAGQLTLQLGCTLVAALGLTATLLAAILGHNDPRTLRRPLPRPRSR